MRAAPAFGRAQRPGLAVVHCRHRTIASMPGHCNPSVRHRIRPSEWQYVCVRVPALVFRRYLDRRHRHRRQRATDATGRWPRAATDRVQALARCSIAPETGRSSRAPPAGRSQGQRHSTTYHVVAGIFVFRGSATRLQRCLLFVPTPDVLEASRWACCGCTGVCSGALHFARSRARETDTRVAGAGSQMSRVTLAIGSLRAPFFSSFRFGPVATVERALLPTTHAWL